MVQNDECLVSKQEKTSWWLRTINDPDKKVVIHRRFEGKVVRGSIKRIARHDGELPADHGENKGAQGHLQ